MASDPFYVVWNPKGPHSPRERHSAMHLAEAEAERLAVQNPGQDFYVLATVSRTRTTKPIEVERFDPDIPF
jgi:hypothetical protein